jgi:hypothetical protein
MKCLIYVAVVAALLWVNAPCHERPTCGSSCTSALASSEAFGLSSEQGRVWLDNSPRAVDRWRWLCSSRPVRSRSLPALDFLGFYFHQRTDRDGFDGSVSVLGSVGRHARNNPPNAVALAVHASQPIHCEHSLGRHVRNNGVAGPGMDWEVRRLTVGTVWCWEGLLRRPITSSGEARGSFLGATPELSQIAPSVQFQA